MYNAAMNSQTMDNTGEYVAIVTGRGAQLGRIYIVRKFTFTVNRAV